MIFLSKLSCCQRKTFLSDIAALSVAVGGNDPVLVKKMERIVKRK